MRTIVWNNNKKKLEIIDQTVLPTELRILELGSCSEVEGAIRSMAVRGAPAIGIAAAFGLALAGLNSSASESTILKQDLKRAGDRLVNARPTANTLGLAVQKFNNLINAFEGTPDEIRQLLVTTAQSMVEEDIAINKAISQYGADLINDGDHIVHHCNTGALAAVDYGTALGCIRMAHEQGKHIHVYVDETRPMLQGSRLTAWELAQYGIPYDIIVDSASGYMMRSGQIDKVMFGADRVAANGDVVNKVGTYMLSLAALDTGIPAFAVFPSSAVDHDIASGDLVTIEQRDPAEVLNFQYHGNNTAPENATAVNYVFDITPHRLLSGMVTEKGVFYPPFFRDLALLHQQER